MRILLVFASTLVVPGCGFLPAQTGEHDSSTLARECYAAPTGTIAATVQYRLETFQRADSLYVRVTLDPRFVDNTFGTNAIGWMKKRDFKQLVGSDHAQLVFSDAAGGVVLDAKFDYISEDATSPSGYANLGVRGGDGTVLVGDPAAVLGATSSLTRNLNERGYGMYVVDSPSTDANYTANGTAPDWEFNVVYEAWIANTTFGSAGFGNADLNFIHASPSKASSNTIVVHPEPCPPECDNPDGCWGGGGGGGTIY